VLSTSHTIELVVNGGRQTLAVEPSRRLVDVLREDLGLTGTKVGCEVGVCGACTVLVDGAPVSACLMLAVLIDGADVRTVEGLADDGQLSPLQDAFIREGGFQCGICTPGQLLAATALLEEQPEPSDSEVRAWLMGNLCRCTGYYGVVRSVLAAMTERNK
jgi:carbon-monoxide dehydrogenase small subunit